MKYRKKPVVIEAVFFDASPLAADAVVALAGESDRLLTFDERGCIIATLEGDMLANFGDFIIKGVNGEFYPCKPDIFAKTYEPVCEECGHWSEIGQDCTLVAPETGCLMLYGKE